MQTIQEKEKKVTGFFSRKFYYAFRALFHPVTRLLILLHVTPNMVTVLSMVFGAAAGFMFAQNRLWAGMVYGYFMAFADIVDGQLAKATGTESRFGGVLDSAVDRYTEFFIFGGLGIRYYTLGELPWTLLCAVAFINSVMVSYVKARAEAEGFDCNVGRFQRPERLAFLAVGLAFGGILLDVAIMIIAFGALFTVFRRLRHVWRQNK